MARFLRNLFVAPLAAILVCFAYCFAFGIVNQACALEQPAQPDAAVERDLDLDAGGEGTDGLVGAKALTNPGASENVGAEKPGESEALSDRKDEEPLPEGDDQNGDTGPSLEPASDADETSPETPKEDQALVAQGESRPTVALTADAHVQNKSWMGAKSINDKGTIIGTTGQGLRLEALKFTISGASGAVQCQAHVQNIGWQNIANNTAGTTGRALRVEAIRLALIGELSQWYDLSYQAHVQNKGWMDWVSNGAVAGTSGQALRMEALNIKLVPKSSKAAQASDGIIGVRTSAHVQNIGWQTAVESGATAGTTGQSLRVEALRMTLDAGAVGGGIQANAHVQNIGWQGYRSSEAGTTGKGLRMEAVQLKLTGGIANTYDIVYRAHVQNIGWQPWTLDEGIAGTTGRSLRVEALQVKLVKKSTGLVVSEGTYFLTPAKDVSMALSSSGGSGAQAATAAYSTGSMGERYYVRSENGGITLQSVNTGLFLEASGSNVVQKAYGSSNSAQVWIPVWNGGFTLTNKAAGKAASLSGGKAVTGGSQKWMFSTTSIVPDGNYIVTNVAAGKVLDVNGASWASGANIMVYDANGGGNQTFTFANTSGNVYKVTCTMTGRGVDVANGSTANGANVRQWSANGSNAQQWSVSIDRNGKFTFTNRASGKVMTAAGSGASGANVSSSANTGANTQKWTLKASSYQPDGVLQRAMAIADGLSSSTAYFIAVDLSNHRVVVMQGSRGNWTPVQNWTVSTGAPSSPTVLGDFTVGSRGYSFGHGYTCYYWTQFYGDYLFHSVLYNEGTRTIQDGRLGYSISAGCVRMNIDNAKWIHDVIPSGTHVKTYY